MDLAGLRAGSRRPVDRRLTMTFIRRQDSTLKLSTHAWYLVVGVWTVRGAATRAREYAAAEAEGNRLIWRS